MSRPIRFFSYVCVFFLGVLISGVIEYVTSRSVVRSDRDHIKTIMGQLQIGDSKEYLSSFILTHAGGLRIVTEKGGNAEKWYLFGQQDFLQRHWVLAICLNENRLVGAVVGTGDEVYIQPSDAPAPIGVCGPDR